MGFDLGEIVHPLTKEKFISDFWPHRLYVTNAPSKRFQPLYDLDYFGSAEELLSIYPCRISIQRPDGFTARVPDGKTAIRFYRGGFTCYMRDLERYIPSLREIALQLDRDIGLPKASIKCSVFCSNGESGASMHSDYDLNFQLVLKGKKRWRVAQNHHIVNQTQVCLSGDRPQRDPFQLQLAHRRPFPECMPADAQTVDLYAGGVIFVPRGTWHETETIGDGECFSLNFAMKGPQWLTVLLRAIKRRFIMDPPGGVSLIAFAVQSNSSMQLWMNLPRCCLN